MISLKHILNEQLQTPVVDHMPAIAAKGIYNSKGYAWDDEKGATKLIKQKNNSSHLYWNINESKPFCVIIIFAFHL